MSPQSEGPLAVPQLPDLNPAPSNHPFMRWLRKGGEGHAHHGTQPWWAVLWLTGVDYFSTLGYQPGLALLAAGAISPIATLVLVLVTLLGALPVYAQVAKRSYIGQGSIAMLERLLRGWKSKVLVLSLLGFAATDFIITITLSAADAAAHVVENPLVPAFLHHSQVPITLALITVLTGIFLAGVTEAVAAAVAVGVPYILLSATVVVRGLAEIASRDELVVNWRAALVAEGSLRHGLLLAALLSFPKLALGLSGFETGVSVMPLVRGAPDDGVDGGAPKGRIRNARKLLAAAALLMSVLLIGSSFITAVLIPPEQYREGGDAYGRALSFLAHQFLGHGFGTLYDLFTILILGFAGASAIAGLLNLIPRYLPRFGMAPPWVAHPRPLILIIYLICVLVTLIFHADVEAQGGAYATGVLVLMLSAAFAVALALWHERRKTLSIYFWGVTALFLYTLVDNIVLRHDGVVIAGIFILMIVLASTWSRWRRATEFRVEKMVFADDESKFMFEELRGRKVNLVPLKRFDPDSREDKAAELREHYRIEGPLAFLHIKLTDDRSEFAGTPTIWIMPWGDDYLITVSGAPAIANTVAYLSELLDPKTIFLGLTHENQVSQAMRYLLLGEGETGILVYQILLRHWRRTPASDIRPNIFIMSE